MSKPTWINDTLPDADMTVLVRRDCIEYPIWPGYHNGEKWQAAEGGEMDVPVLGWMELETAAKRLDLA